jgi:hypothetical protein
MSGSACSESPRSVSGGFTILSNRLIWNLRANERRRRAELSMR